MKLIEAVEDRVRTGLRASSPVGPGVVDRWEAVRGHDDDRFSPDSYGDYIVTSNEIYSIIDLRARLIASLPIRLYDRDGPEKREVTRGDLFDLLHFVNPHWTPYRLKKQTEMSLGLWGESYWVIERDRLGVPREIWWVKPSLMKPVPDPKAYIKGFLFTPPGGGAEIGFRPNEVVWQRYPNPIDEYSGLSPLAAARQAADTASAMMRSNKEFFDQGMQLAGYVVPPEKTTYDEDTAKRLEKRLQERFAGSDKAHRWAVLRMRAELKQLSVSPKDAEFVNGLNMTLRQACRAYGVPSPLMYDLEHATLANLTEFDKALWTHALVPECTFMAEELREQLLPMFPRSTRPKVGHLEFDLSRVASLQESEAAVWEREASQIERGAMLINEWRKKYGLPPVPWGDTWWAPVNKAPIDSEGQVAPATEPSPGEGDDGDDDPENRTLRRLAHALDATPALNGHRTSIHA